MPDPRVVNVAFPVHGRGGLDTARQAVARPGTRPRSTTTGGWCAKRSRGTAARRWTRRRRLLLRLLARARRGGGGGGCAAGAAGAHVAGGCRAARADGAAPGEPVVSEAGYHGLGVHRAARIMAAGTAARSWPRRRPRRCSPTTSCPVWSSASWASSSSRISTAPSTSTSSTSRGCPAVRGSGPATRRLRAPKARTELAEATAGARSPLHRRPARHRRLRGRARGGGGDSGLRARRNEARRRRRRSSASRTTPSEWSTPQSRTIVDEAPGVDSPQRVAAGEGSIWVTSPNGGGSVMRLDPESHDVIDTIEVGNGPVGIAVGAEPSGWPTRSTAPSRASTRRPARKWKRSRSGTRRPASPSARRGLGHQHRRPHDLEDRSRHQRRPAADRRRRGRALDRGRRRRRLGDRPGRQRARADRPALERRHRNDPRRQRSRPQSPTATAPSG